MTKSDIKDLIAELEEEEVATLEEGRTSADPVRAEYFYGYSDALCHCIEMIKGRSGYYD